MKMKELRHKIRVVEDLQRHIRGMKEIKESNFGDVGTATFLMFDIWVSVPIGTAIEILDINLKTAQDQLAHAMKELNLEEDDGE